MYHGFYSPHRKFTLFLRFADFYCNYSAPKKEEEMYNSLARKLELFEVALLCLVSASPVPNIVQIFILVSFLGPKEKEKQNV